MINFHIENPKLISVNEQYMHPVRKCKDGRYRSYVCPSPYLKEVKSFYDEVLKELVLDEDISDISSQINKNTGISLTICISFPEKDLYSEDGSNFIKSIEDSVTRRIKIDDCRNLNVNVVKLISDDENLHLDVFVKNYNTKRRSEFLKCIEGLLQERS